MTVNFKEYVDRKKEKDNERYMELERERQKYCKMLDGVDVEAASKHILGKTGDDPIFARYAETQAKKMFETSRKIDEIKNEQKRLMK